VKVLGKEVSRCRGDASGAEARSRNRAVSFPGSPGRSFPVGLPTDPMPPKKKARGSRAHLSPQRLRRLVDAASRVRERAYAPYSKFRVGAAVGSPAGKVHAGANVENASYGLCLCAERAAVAAAVAAGERRLDSVAVVSSSEVPAPPCGMCLQTLLEFGGPDLTVILSSPSRCQRFALGELLPHAFGPRFL